MAQHFDHKTAAQRYATGRPYFHPLVVDHIKAFLKLDAHVDRVLDAGCGTGQSATALKEISHHVVGVDASAGMIEQAPQDPAIEYIVAPCEDIPTEDASFDMVTAGLSFHWFDRPKFLSEARRLLRRAGWLVIYNNSFRAQMKETPAFTQWCRETCSGSAGTGISPLVS
jgi:ubiquinone/menaquinone biosynthesis C-methylase UbiE